MTILTIIVASLCVAMITLWGTFWFLDAIDDWVEPTIKPEYFDFTLTPSEVDALGTALFGDPPSWFCWAEHGENLFYVPGIPAGPEEISAVMPLFFSGIEEEIDWALRNQNGVPLDSWACLASDLADLGGELSGLSFDAGEKKMVGIIDSPALHPAPAIETGYEEFAVAPTAAAIPLHDPGEAFVDEMAALILSAYDTDFLECGSDEATFFYCEEVAC